MAFKIFGFQIGKPEHKNPDGTEEFKSPIVPQNTDGSISIQAGGVYGTFVDMENAARSEAELVTRYREMSIQPECESAIDQIVYEAIVAEQHKPPVKLITDNLPEYSEEFKEKIRSEFDNVLELLNFSHQGHNIFRRWYVDGRLYYNIIIDNDSPSSGIQELRYIDPRRIRKIREIVKKRNAEGVEVVDSINEYYIYNERGITNTQATAIMGVRFAPDAIAHIHSNVVDSSKNMTLSRLHKAIKPLNQLRMMEDAVVIYRIARAPERRIFYVDVGQLPKQQAEDYIKGLMLKYRNKMVYDATTGEIRDDKKFQSMMEDFWLPRREGSKGTEIDTLQGGQALGQMEEVEYFQQKLYKSLNVPISRLNNDSGGLNMGRSAEISRDETNFIKFINQLQTDFMHLFDILLSTQLFLKGIILKEDWAEIKRYLIYDFVQNSFYTELKEAELRSNRLEQLGLAQQYVGLYFSKEYVMRNILKMTDEDIKTESARMKREIAVIPDSLEAQIAAQKELVSFQANIQADQMHQQAEISLGSLNHSSQLELEKQKVNMENERRLRPKVTVKAPASKAKKNVKK